MYTVEVNLDERSYPIYIGENLLSADGLREWLVPHIPGSQCLVLTNETVNALYGDVVREALGNFQVDSFTMQDGEEHKNLHSYTEALDYLMAKRHNRTTCVIALGGGVVGDLAGFVAATFQRGVKFIQVPTTLLAQVDSSVGGKTAVNHPAGKNMIGAFYQPQAVVIDTQVLSSLPQREFVAGIAEVVKYGVIDDAEFFAWLEQNSAAIVAKSPTALGHIIARSCEVKAKIVALDEREGGIRAILNFGHTFGHAIENLAGYGQWLHGEAVSIGMVMAADFSRQLGLLDEDSQSRIVTLLDQLNLPVSLPEDVDIDDMLSAMGMDKKVDDGKLRFIVCEGLGSATVCDDFSDEILRQVLTKYCRGSA